MDLQQILQPVTLEVFFAEYWNKRPLLVRRENSSYYKQSLAIEHPERLILSGRLKYPEVRLVRKGVPAPVETMQRAGLLGDAGSRDAAQLEPVLAAYNDGYTLVVRAENASLPVSALCSSLAAELRFPFFAELFCTPSGSQGSNLHHDTFDVFILQLAGRKHWKVYEPSGNESPKSGAQTTEAEVGSLLFDNVLEAGDMLYVPRPFPHVAFAADEEPSFHLSLAGRPWRRSDILREALDMALEQTSELHESLPYDYLQDEGDTQKEALETMIPRVAEGLDAGKIRERLAARFLLGLQATGPAYLGKVHAPVEVSLNTSFCLAPQTFFTVSQQQDTLLLTWPGHQMRLPPKTLQTLLAIRRERKEPFTARSLSSNLNEDSRLVLLKRLLAAGLLMTAGTA